LLASHVSNTGVSNLVELLVDGYACDEPVVRAFITGAPGFQTKSVQPVGGRNGDSNSKSDGGGSGGRGVRRVGALKGRAKMDVGIEVTDWVNPDEQPWA
jgi:hypothetical protein